MSFYEDLFGANPNAPRKVKVIFFRDDYTYVERSLKIEDSCALWKMGGEVQFGWGVSPSVLFPMKGSREMVMLVNERDGNPMDPYNTLDKKERFTEAFLQRKAQEQEDKAAAKPHKTLIEKMALYITVIGGLEIATACLIVILKYLDSHPTGGL